MSQLPEPFQEPHCGICGTPRSDDGDGCDCPLDDTLVYDAATLRMERVEVYNARRREWDKSGDPGARESWSRFTKEICARLESGEMRDSEEPK